jgi:hypothetical protein
MDTILGSNEDEEMVPLELDFGLGDDFLTQTHPDQSLEVEVARRDDASRELDALDIAPAFLETQQLVKDSFRIDNEPSVALADDSIIVDASIVQHDFDFPEPGLDVSVADISMNDPNILMNPDGSIVMQLGEGQARQDDEQEQREDAQSHVDETEGSQKEPRAKRKSLPKRTRVNRKRKLAAVDEATELDSRYVARLARETDDITVKVRKVMALPSVA